MAYRRIKPVEQGKTAYCDSVCPAKWRIKIRRHKNHTPSIYAENPVTKADIRLYAINISCDPIER